MVNILITISLLNSRCVSMKIIHLAEGHFTVCVVTIRRDLARKENYLRLLLVE